MIAAAAAVAVVALGAAGAIALMGQDDDPGATAKASATATTPPSQAAGGQTPADERCTAEIKANPRWVCLTSAKFKGETLTIRYTANFDGAQPGPNSYHLHIYGGDGVTPAADTEGLQAMNPGHWYEEDQKPSVRTASSNDYRKAIGDSPKVCARIAKAGHLLVQDANGTYVTGNCVPIDRTNQSTTARQTTTQTAENSSVKTHPTTTPAVTVTTHPPTDPASTWSPSALVAPAN